MAVWEDLDRILFSPRKRRCFYGLLVLEDNGQVFSAQAEVFYLWVCLIKMRRIP